VTDWGKLPTKWAININSRRGEHRILKMAITLAASIWVTVALLLFVINVSREADGYDLFMSGGWFLISALCWYRWVSRVL